MADKVSVAFLLVIAYCAEAVFPFFGGFQQPARTLDFHGSYSVNHFPDFHRSYSYNHFPDFHKSYSYNHFPDLHRSSSYNHFPELYPYQGPEQHNFPLSSMSSGSSSLPWLRQTSALPSTWWSTSWEDAPRCHVYCENMPVCSKQTSTTTQRPATKCTTAKPTTTTTTTTRPHVKNKHHKGDHKQDCDNDSYQEDMVPCGGEDKHQHSKGWKDDFFKGAHSSPWAVSMSDSGISSFVYGTQPEHHVYSTVSHSPL